MGVKNQFGYVKSKPESGIGGANGPRQQPPISRPVPSPLPPQDGGGPLSAAMRGLLDQRLYGGPAHHQLESSGVAASLLAKRYNNNPHQSLASPSSSSASSAFTTASQLSSLLNCSSIAELAGSAGLGGCYDTGSSSSKTIGMSSAFDKPMGVVGLTAFDKVGLGGGGGGGGMTAYENNSNSSRVGSMLGGGNPYERWSNGSDSLFGLGGGGQSSGGGMMDCGYKGDRGGLGGQVDMLADLVGGSSSKLLSGGGGGPPLSGGSGGVGGGAPLYPPKSQIKRQKMIYHCKFGEFGILGTWNTGTFLLTFLYQLTPSNIFFREMVTIKNFWLKVKTNFPS